MGDYEGGSSGSDESSDGGSSASASTQEAKSRPMVPQEPPLMRLYAKHIREHGAALVARMEQAAILGAVPSAPSAAALAAPSDQTSPRHPAPVAAEPPSPAPAPAPAAVLQSEVASLRQDMCDIAAKLDAVLSEVNATRPPALAPEPASASVAAPAASGLVAAGSPAPSSSVVLEQAVQAQQLQMDQLLASLKRTASRVDQMHRERELEMLMVDEDSLSDLGARTMAASLRQQAAAKAADNDDDKGGDELESVLSKSLLDEEADADAAEAEAAEAMEEGAGAAAQQKQKAEAER